VLYPTPSVAGGSAEVPLGRVTRTGDFRFDPNSPEETVWLVWSSQPHQQLERAKRWVNPEDQGRIKDGVEAAIVLGLLMNNQKGTTARPDDSGTRIGVSGASDLLIRRVTLKTRR
jgi:hypothetical protein